MTRVSPRQYSPDIAIPPGATIQEILGSLCMSQEDLADRMDKRPSHVNEIISGRRPVTVDIAIALERVLGSPASFWLNLEKNYQLTLARLREAASREQDIAWMRDVIPITELVKRGIVPGDRDPGVRLQAVLRFFAVSSVDAWKEYWERQITGAVAFRRSPAQAKHVGRMAAWLRLGELAVQGRCCGRFNRPAFMAALREIRNATAESPNVFEPMFRDLANCGVLVSLVEEIPGAGINGATRWIGKSRAHMQLSLRYRTDDQFWFTFFHEAGHILLHDKRDVFLEGIAGLSGDSKTKEEEADRFAADFLIPPQYTRSLQEIHTKAQAKRLAEQLGISPGIVVGRIQHDGYITPALANYWELKRQFQWEKHLDTEE